MKEIWKDIPNYKGLYQASNLGRVKNKKTNKILKSSLSMKNGYNQLVLCKNDEHKVFKIHRLIAKTFIPNPENKPQVNHIDGNKQNNNVENLEWCTIKENLNHAINSGLFTKERSAKISRANKGKNNPRAKILLQYDLNNNFIKEWNYAKEASKKLKINYCCIKDCCNNRQKTAGGYIWKYKNTQ